MITSSDPRVTYTDLHWPTVTYSDPKAPKVTYIDPTYLLLPLPTSPDPSLMLEIKRSMVEGRKVVATKFSVKHQGKYRIIYNLQSINDL